MVSGTLFHFRKTSWPPDEYVTRATLQLLDYDSAAPPKQAWRRRLNSHANILKEFSITFMEAVKMVRLGIRLWSYVREEASHGRKAPIDPFTKELCKPSASQGVPLGGMGSGSISRGFRGEFRQWQIVPGLCEASPVMPNQFSIFISRDAGSKSYASVLAPGVHEGLGKSNDHGVSSWGWNLSGQHSSYHALFPRAWTIYDGEPDPDLKVSCRQISPFLPHNYRDSSLPTAVFVYTLVNTGKERAKVSLAFTWANSIGGISHLSGDHVNEPFIGDDGVSGVLLHHKTAKDNPPVTFAVAACETQNVNVTVLPCFGLSEDSNVTAKDMWKKMTKDGHFERDNFNAGKSVPSSPGETLCAAVSASTWVEPHGKSTIAFAVAWSSPKIKFLKGSSYYRRYTKYYGKSEGAAKELVHYALTNYTRWEEEIERWQTPILEDERLPEWYKFTLFNELYFLVAGGTIWIDSPLLSGNQRGDPQQLKIGNKSNVTVAKANLKEEGSVVEQSTRTLVTGSESDDDVNNDVESREKKEGQETCDLNEQNDQRSWSHNDESSSADDDDDDVGRFLYLEGVEYIMWCTYDVHFYASFALLALFPKIELSIQREFAKAVLSEDGRRVKFLAEGNWGIRKVRGAVPHDLGTHDPWNEMNAYNIHDTSKWKDLNPKFVLQVYRDFTSTGDMAFGVDVWPSVRAAMEYMEQYDRDGDGLIENDGFPDQTYDTWTVHGVSAYCGCLWIAALQAAAAMAYQVGDKDFAEKCKRKFVQARKAYEEKLWNGTYYNYDSGSSSNSKSIQTDQLAGQWYTASSGLPDLFDEYKIRSSLQKIFDFNVMKVKGGKMGAVNGMYPNGRVDETCMQSREIWSGVTYGAAATMILAGMEEQAFATAEGIFVAGWSEDGFGYWFQTPEAWTMDGHFRSLIYMRPLSIWGMQWALSRPRAILGANPGVTPGGTPVTINTTTIQKTSSHSVVTAAANLTKLTQDNFRLWKGMLVPFLRGNDLYKFVNGSYPCPSELLNNAPNPEFNTWIQQDQLILSVLLVSLSPHIAAQVLDLPTSASVWEALHASFASQTAACIGQLHLKLATLVKSSDEDINGYFNRARDLCSSLAVTGHPVSDMQFQSFVLRGLPDEYDSIVTNLVTRPDGCSPQQIYNHLLTYENMLKQKQKTVTEGVCLNATGTTNNSGSYKGKNSKKGRGGYQNFQNSQTTTTTTSGRGRGTRSYYNNNKGYGRGQTVFTGQPDTRPSCQICLKKGHVAALCYYRYSHTHQPPAPPTFSANATTNYTPSEWLPYTAASHHFTGDFSHLNLNASDYAGSEIIALGDGSALPISRSGHSSNYSTRTG